MIDWFVFDLGNTLIRLAYERVLANVCRNASIRRDELVELLESAGGYRDLERGAVTFAQFHRFMRDRAGYRGSMRELVELWSDFFDGTIPGMEELLERVRGRYRVAFLSNSNEIHAELIPRRFTGLFRSDDRFVFSHEMKSAKPDAEIFQKTLEVLGAQPSQVAFIDDMLENVLAARALGMTAFQFLDAASLQAALSREGLL